MRADFGRPVKLGGRVIGMYYSRSRTFVKKVFRSKHYLRKLQAWGIDSAVLKALKEKGCRCVRIFDKESNVLYETTPSKMMNDGVEKDFGSGAQFFLHEAAFDRSDDNAIEVEEERRYP